MAKLTFRTSEPGDVDTLVALYDRHYEGGYSACFDRYGPATPRDFWWVQSEKSLTLVEVNRKVVGLIVIGRSGRRLLAEEVILDVDRGERDDLLPQLHEWLTRRFQQARQEVLSIRGAETNAVVLAMARTFGFVFADALVVAVGGRPAAGAPTATGRPPAGGPAHDEDRSPGEGPRGYRIRRARPSDEQALSQLHEETVGPVRASDLKALWTLPDVRILLAERDTFPVGFLIAQVRDGAGRWLVGVRQTHRGKGLGRALAAEALQFFRARRVPAVTTYWGTDSGAIRLARAIGAKTERVFLYFQRPL
ncbi:MAG: GNAT family N-acetyltransferase [Armatimonadota bacterium]|nr:GNAT family N-acetyltransferase [Armatimonadota bacterium]MDR7450474.1 GNAT family N-acetyltransferase [Armatimonadota bacterium]MDR7466943.1 GNAT family N-acetyltransferase [Armatimonadota bacterium]MDR7493515.1 GNAT family N-acetyltransferase [Armatimonadota bacterium]MDR7498780.1 GNAT family N-acetyltransferase [Armatimonadota bacterium]